MKRNKLFLNLLMSLLLILTIVSLSINVKGADTLDFTFENDVMYSENNFNYNDTFNLRNQTSFTQDYEATYSFENEVIGTSGTDINFVSSASIDSNTNCSIINFLDGHNKIINFTDNNNAGAVLIHNSFINITSGTIEFWIYEPPNNKYGYFYIQEDGIIKGGIRWMIDGGIDYFNGVWISEEAYTGEEWKHIRIDFNCTTDTYDFYFNGILKQNGVSFDGVATSINRIQLGTGSSTTDYSYYFDAFGYSWDGYNATYSFTDDTNGNDPADWTVFEGGGSIEVINLLDNHYKVVMLNDTSNSLNVQLSNSFNALISGTVEYWIYTDSNTNSVFHNFDSVIQFYFYTNGYIRVLDGSTSTWYNVITYSINTWYHLKVDFDCSTQLFNITFNNNLIAENYGFFGSTAELDRLYFASINTHQDYVFYIDGVGFDWEPYYDIGDNLIHYSIGDNIVPLIETNSLVQEVDKFEFAFEGDNDLYDVGDDNPSTWDDVENGYDHTNIALDTHDSYDRAIKIEGIGSTHEITGIEKSFDVENGIINVSWSYYYTEMDNAYGYYNLSVYSYDDTLISRIGLIQNGNPNYVTLFYYNGTDNVNLITNIQANKDLSFNLYIASSCFLRYSYEGDYNSTFKFLKLDDSKEGLGKIDLLSFTYNFPSDDQILYLDYIGVYINSTSLSNERTYVSLELGTEWNVQHHNLIRIIAETNMTLYMTNFIYQVDISTLVELEGNMLYIGTEVLINEYDLEVGGVHIFSNPFLVFYFYHNYSLSNIDIEGVKLVQGTNEYRLIYSHDNIDVDESYFWVDSSNRLQFSLTVNNSNLEYIQAFFNIDDLSSENRSISFVSNINGDSVGQFSVNYDDATNSNFELPFYQTITRVILPQTKKIESFTLLITDNDLDENDLCTGFISTVKLIYNPDITFTITTLNLLGIIVPLIIMLIPPLAMHKKFGVMGVVAMFLLMALVCVVSSLIPVWLFFIIAFGSIGFLFLKERQGEGF